MPTTFKAVVYSDNKKKDGTYNIKIRITHRRQTLKISTNIFVTAHQLTRGLKLKDHQIIDETEQLIANWRSIVGRLGVAADIMTVKQIVEYIRQTELKERSFSLDFIEYMRTVSSSMCAGTASNYRTTANALARYTGGKPLDISFVTARMLSDFERFLRSEPSQRGSQATGAIAKGNRAVSLYMGIIRATHNRAKKEFNDEEVGLIRIPRSPFAHYDIPGEAAPRKRAISVELIQRIIDLEDEPAVNSRRNLARDCFLLSFALAGMNAIDLLTCPNQNNDNILVYNRAKTSSRRADHAEMHIRIEEQIRPLIERYRDKTENRFFRFYQLYASGNNFNTALNEGLKRVDEAIRHGDDIQERTTFYTARHSWATIARSAALGIDKYTVHEALNHVSDMKITDRYIDRDWSVIWNANAQVVGLFDWSAISR